MSILRKGVITTAGRATGAAVQLLNTILIARLLKAEGAGHVQLVLTVNVFLGALATLGIGAAGNYAINRQKLPTREVTTLLFWIAGLWLPVYGLAVWMLYLVLPDFFGRLPAAILLAQAAQLVSSQATVLFVPVLLTEFRAASVAALDVVQPVVNFSVNLALYALGLLTVQTALLAPLAASAVGAVLAVWMIRRHLDFSGPPRVRLLPGLLSFGVKFAAANIAFNAHTAAPYLMMRLLLPDDFAPLGFYRVAMSVCALIGLVATAADPVMFSAWTQEADVERRARQVELATRLYTLMGLAIALVTAAAAPYILLIYGRQFVAGTLLLNLLALATVVQIVANTFQNLLSASGRPAVSTLLLCGTLAVNLAMNVLLVPAGKAEGAAAAYLAAAMAYLVGGSVLAGRLCGVRLSACFIPRREDIRRLAEALHMPLRPRDAA